MVYSSVKEGGSRCDYCAEGNVAEDGWHRYPVITDEGYENFDQPYRVPCAIDPPTKVEPR